MIILSYYDSYNFCVKLGRNKLTTNDVLMKQFTTKKKLSMPIFVEKPLIQTAPIKVTRDNKVTFAPSTNIHQSKLDSSGWT